MSPLSRQQLSQLYRPQSVKVISTGNAWATGGSLTISGPQVDLSVPLRGLRIKFSGRDVIGTAAMTSANPLGYLNLIKRILLTGRNARAGGANQTLLDLDLASWFLYMTQFVNTGRQGAPFRYTIDGVTVNFIGYPIANSNLVNVATGTYDFKIVVDIPFYPYGISDPFKLGYFMRNQEWGDSVQLQLTYGTVTAGGTTDSLGVEAATTTHTLTSFGAGTGSPQVDIYGLPAIAGLDLDSAFTPGFFSRVAVPVTTVIQSAGSVNTRIATLQKQRTARIVFMSGVSTVTPAFASFNDTNVTTLGLVVGGNRTVRENDDIDPHKHEISEHYGTQIVQGVTSFDFLQGGNPDSGYAGEQIGEGATFELRGTIAGLANAFANVIQEIELYRPSGRLYLPV